MNNKCLYALSTSSIFSLLNILFWIKSFVLEVLIISLNNQFLDVIRWRCTIRMLLYSFTKKGKSKLVLLFNSSSFKLFVEWNIVVIDGAQITHMYKYLLIFAAYWEFIANGKAIIQLICSSSVEIWYKYT